MMKINHKQLIFAREYRGYSQTELSSKIAGLSQSNLSKFEKGIDSLSIEVINSIISFLDFPKEFFYKQIYIVSDNAHYRKKATIKKSEKINLENNNKLIGYVIDQMSDTIEFPEFKFREIDLEDGYTPSAVAKFTRKTLSLKDQPVKDIINLFEKNGIIVIEFDTPISLFDGVSFTTDQGYKVIVINKNMSNDRKRFTLAHELGHIIMHSSSSFLISDYRDKEKEANEFASEFLMPEEFIRNSLMDLKLSYLKDLKYLWLTSMASIIRRARDLGCIKADKYQYYNVELSRKGYKKEEPFTVYLDSPKIFDTSYRLFKDQLDYSDFDLANAFSLPIDIIQSIFKPNSGKLKVQFYI